METESGVASKSGPFVAGNGPESGVVSSQGDGAGRERPRSLRAILGDAAAIGAMVSGLALLGLAWSCPTRRDISRVEAGVDGFVGVTVDQIRVVRASLDDLDQERIHSLGEAASGVAEHAAAFADDVRIDFNAIDGTSEAMEMVAKGLEALGPALSVDHLEEICRECEEAAAALEERAIPAAKAAAASIDEASARAEAQAKVFAEMLRSAELDGDIVFEVSDAIREFGESVADVEQFLRTVDGTLPAITKALTGTAVELRGWHKSRLPIGGLVDREGLAEKADGLDQAAEALENLSDQFLPAVLRSLNRSSEVLRTLSTGSRQMSERREEIAALLKKGPDLIVSIGSEVGEFGQRLADVVGATERVAAVAGALRSAAAHARRMEAALPAARKMADGAASAVKAVQQRLVAVSKNRQPLVERRDRIVRSLDSVGSLMRRANDDLAGKLVVQKSVLESLESQCVGLRQAIPEVDASVGWWLFWGRACACIFGLTLIGQGASRFVIECTG